MDGVYMQGLDSFRQDPHNGSRDKTAWQPPIDPACIAPSISARGDLIELIGQAVQPLLNLWVQIGSDEPDHEKNAAATEMTLGSLRNAAKWCERGRVDLQGFCAGGGRNYSREVARLQPLAEMPLVAVTLLVA